MRKTFATIVFLCVCLSHTAGLCFVSHSPQVLETKNWQLETDEGSSKVLKFEISKVAVVSHSPENLCASVSLCEKISTSHITETFQYDNNGALTNWQGSPLWKGGGGNAAGGLSLAYNALGQVSSLAANSYSYDALGNRVVMDGKLFIPNHSDALKRPVIECNELGEIIRYYIWGDNRLLGFIDSNGTLTVAHSDKMTNGVSTMNRKASRCMI